MNQFQTIPVEKIETEIILIRNHKVMLSLDLANLYGIETKVLIQAVKRNIERFPKDFMFQLSKDEYKSLRSQFVTLKRGQHSKYLRYALTEQGVAMLSSVLKSPRAIKVNLQIIRTFVKLREIISSHKELAERLNELEQKYDSQFKIVFEAIRELMAPPPERPKKIFGFPVKEKRISYGQKN